ncbi:hypothetical protein HDU96_009531 [Phlyctochytrium bullatum]|nr:hypothetical protein HDU96_009531 [Phlyctochytrium bullatum]
MTQGRILDGSTIPADAFATGWPKLQSLSLFNSLVGGTLPPSLTALRQLQVLNLAGNKNLQGRLPDDPAAFWPMLSVLSVSGSNITANLNDNWSKLTELYGLDNNYQRSAAQCQAFLSSGAFPTSATSQPVSASAPIPTSPTISPIPSTNSLSNPATSPTSIAPSGTTTAQDNSTVTLSTPALIGIGVGGGILLIALIVLSVILCRRRRRNKSYPSTGLYAPYYPPPPVELYQAAPIYQTPSASVPQHAAAVSTLPAKPTSLTREPLPPDSMRLLVPPSKVASPTQEPIPPPTLSRREPVPPASTREPVPPPSLGGPTPLASARTVPDVVSSFGIRGGGGAGR